MSGGPNLSFVDLNLVTTFEQGQQQAVDLPFMLDLRSFVLGVCIFASIGLSIGMITRHTLRGKRLLLKRDDLFSLDVAGTTLKLNGNKIRKLKSLERELLSSCKNIVVSYGGYQSNSMLALSNVVSAMNKQRSQDQHKLDFFYFSKPIPKWLKDADAAETNLNDPSSFVAKTNYGVAKRNGARFVEVDAASYEHLTFAAKSSKGFPSILTDTVMDAKKDSSKCSFSSSSVFFVPQGGALPEAAEGVKDMVDEVIEDLLHEQNQQDQQDQQEISKTKKGSDFACADTNMDMDVKTKTKRKKRWVLAIASGTGTTAFYAHQRAQHRREELESRGLFLSIVALPCTDEKDIRRQMAMLHASGSGSGSRNVSESSSERRARHGSAKAKGGEHNKSGEPLPLTVDSLDTGPSDHMPEILISEPRSTRSGFSFAEPSREHYDLWKEVQSACDTVFDLVYSPRAFEVLFEHWDSLEQEGVGVVYYHCGGVEGNVSQEKRYERMKIY